MRECHELQILSTKHYFISWAYFFLMANQVLVNVKTTKGIWETTFQKSTRIKDVILGSRMHFRLPKEAKLVLCRQELPHADFDPDRALVNYNVIDGDVLLLKEVC